MRHTGKLTYFPFLSKSHLAKNEFYIKIQISHICKDDDVYVIHQLSVDTETKKLSLQCSNYWRKT